MTNRTYYAAQSPRGFANEINVYRFPTRAERDAWVSEHKNDGDLNSASCGAYKLTAKKAYQIIGYHGDAATESFNRFVDGISYLIR